MRTATISFEMVRDALRLDTKFFLDSGEAAAKRVQSGVWPLVTVGETFGRQSVWMPCRFSRVWATNANFGKPLLVPYDGFRYVPWSDSYLSSSQVLEYKQAEVSRGMLLIVRSGRNCGPVTMVDSFLERFTVSDDMIRISTELNDSLFYFYAFLSTPTGQSLVRRDRNGSVIDHLGPDQIAALRYPVVDDGLQFECAKKFRIGFEKREQARLLLDKTKKEFLLYFNLSGVEDNFSDAERARRFSITRGQIIDRFDAEPHAPRYATWRRRIQDVGGCALSEIAEIFKPAGRYKTNYVGDSRFGVRMMNGRQISQYRPIALQLMNLSTFKDPTTFQLTAGTTLMTADGRAEENLADCVLVAQDREGWAASGHVHRVRPRQGIHPGLVYLACSSAPVQSQLKALATGSVVDALSTGDVASVIVPYANTKETRRLGDAAQEVWELFADASRAEDEAIRDLENEFSS